MLYSGWHVVFHVDMLYLMLTNWTLSCGKQKTEDPILNAVIHVTMATEQVHFWHCVSACMAYSMFPLLI